MVRAFYSKAAKAIMTLSIGSLLTQCIFLASTLMVAKFYTPREFGLYAVVMAVSPILATVFTMSVEQFIVPSQTDEEASKIFRRGIRLLVRNSLICLMALVVLELLKWMDLLSLDVSFFLGYWILVLAIVIGVFTLVQQIVLRARAYRLIAIRGPIQSATIGTSQYVFFLSGFRNLGLLLGEVLGRLIGVLVILPIVRSKLRENKSGRQSNSQKFSKVTPVFVNLASIILDMISVASTLIVASLLFSKEEAGQLGMALRVLSLPVLLFGLSVSQYILSTASHNELKGQLFLKKDFMRLFYSLVAFAALSTILVMFFASRLMIPILGKEWDLSAELLYWLAPISIVSFVWNSLSTVFYLKNLWNLFFRISLTRFLLITFVAGVSTAADLSFNYVIFAIVFSNSLILAGGIITLRNSFLRN
jgi:O-antigen/teichoic acid export membrane protein